MSSDFKSPEDLQKLSQWNSIVNAQIKDPAAAAQYTAPANDLINAVASDRKGLIEGDLLKALLYILAIGVLLFLAFKKLGKPCIVLCWIVISKRLRILSCFDNSLLIISIQNYSDFKIQLFNNFSTYIITTLNATD